MPTEGTQGSQIEPHRGPREPFGEGGLEAKPPSLLLTPPLSCQVQPIIPAWTRTQLASSDLGKRKQDLEQARWEGLECSIS